LRVQSPVIEMEGDEIGFGISGENTDQKNMK